jgi:hypothetical protein
MPSQQLYITPAGRAPTVVSCSKRIVIRGRRVPVTQWTDRLPKVDGWYVIVYSESNFSLWLHTALARMLGTPSTGGLRRHLRRSASTFIHYAVQWSGHGLRVALCDQEPALEGGLANLMNLEQLFVRGQIPIPPQLAAARELRAAFPDVEAILIPASPIESNASRQIFAHVLLVRPSAIHRLGPRPPEVLSAPKSLLGALLTHRAPDRTASMEDPPGRRLWVAPRLAYLLSRRRVAQAKDALRWKLVERPRLACKSFLEFLASPQSESISELLRAVADLVRAILHGWAALLLALAVLVGALHEAGLL